MRKYISRIKNVHNFNVIAAVASALVVGAAGLFIISSRAASGSATLSLSPSSQIVANAAQFTVNIRENSGTAPVNAVQANLTYPAAQLELVSIDSTTSAFPVQAEQAGGTGTINIARGTNGGTSVTGDQLVARVTFKSLMATGSATVSFASGSAVVSSLDNTALLLTTTGGTYAPDTSAPSAPASLSSSNITGSSVQLAWSASTDNVGVTGYKVYRNGVNIATPTTTSYTNTGLTQGTTYQYQVSAIDGAGNESVKSNTISVTTLDVTAPSVPGGLSLQALAHDQVKLTWTASTDTGGSGLAGYKIYRGTSTTPIATVASGITTYTNTGLTGSTSYTYTVSAYDLANNESAKSTAASITTPAPPDTTPPSTPGNLTKTGSTLTSISLSWLASTDNVGVTGYRIYRDSIQIADQTGTTFTDSNLAYGTSYQYTIRAYDAAVNMSSPAILNAATLPLKVGDINRDNAVNIFDLSLLLGKWKTNDAASDLDNSGLVDIFDLSRLLTNWGT
jgi:chitodextrinase